mmetsp:Transcript_20931/g.30421  ORF Transcript_20931/g.30421 Transcript_20931/m.30421 type:complete len:168 (+) Transcript_20931:1346-1849(+)
MLNRGAFEKIRSTLFGSQARWLSDRNLVRKLNDRMTGLPKQLGVKITRAKRGGEIVSEMEIKPMHLAANGFCHAGSIVTLADTSCGYGTFANLPEKATGFTTIELKSNFLGTTLSGSVACEAFCVHSGRSTQVWDATVFIQETKKKIALFRCTQLILYPRSVGTPST